MRFLLSLLLLFLFAISIYAQEQSDDIPYLWYYSALLDGIVIERADGTDSRLLPLTQIQSLTVGVSGPGWSSDGQFFVGRTDNSSGIGQVFVIQLDKEYDFKFSDNFLTGRLADFEWIPDGRPYFIVTKISDRNTGLDPVSFTLVNAETALIVSSVSFVILEGFQTSTISLPSWNLEDGYVEVYTSEATANVPDTVIFRTRLYLDGKIDRQRITSGIPESVLRSNVQLVEGSLMENSSPYGQYEIEDIYYLRNTLNGEIIHISPHSQSDAVGNDCREYEWAQDERYIIATDGRGGDYCTFAVITVASTDGKLLRELGICTWAETCFGWLPSQVDINSLPAGRPVNPILQPTRYIPFEDTSKVYTDRWGSGLRNGQITCEIQQGDDILILSGNDEVVSYNLKTPSCRDFVQPTQVVFDNDLESGLIAVGSWTFFEIFRDSERVLQLNTDALAVEFQDDELWVQNYNNWHIYSVDDLLKAIERNAEE